MADLLLPGDLKLTVSPGGFVYLEGEEGEGILDEILRIPEYREQFSSEALEFMKLCYEMGHVVVDKRIYLPVEGVFDGASGSVDFEMVPAWFPDWPPQKGIPGVKAAAELNKKIAKVREHMEKEGFRMTKGWPLWKSPKSWSPLSSEEELISWGVLVKDIAEYRKASKAIINEAKRLGIRRNLFQE